MNKLLIYTIFTCIFFSFNSLSAQQIETEKVFGGYKFSYNDNALTHKELKEMMGSHKEASQLLKKARTNNVVSSILGGIGGGLIGIPIGAAIANGDPQWALAGVGAAFVGVAIPFSIGANKNAVKAVEKYNSSLGTVQNSRPMEINIIGNSNGIGLALTVN